MSSAMNTMDDGDGDALCKTGRLQDGVRTKAAVPCFTHAGTATTATPDASDL